MIYSHQTWYGVNRHPHTVLQVDFGGADIQHAAWIADQKLQFVNVHSPSGVVRSPTVIRNRLISGKLADHAVRNLLTREVDRRGLSLLVQEYDEVRRDNWREHDEYDLQVSSSLRQRTIEVRSSFCYILPQLERIIQRLSIYGWYVSGNKPIEPPRDFYWQVIYYMRPKDVRKGASWPDLPVFEDQLDAGSVRGYIVGGATKTMLHDRAVSEVRRDQDSAWYQSVSPICRGLDEKEILNATLTF